MDLSVIMINDNTNEFCQRCVDSIIENTNNIYFEIIVIDFAESINEVIKFNDKKVKVIRSENKNISNAYNKAIERAIGRYILVLNNNVVIENECFENCIKYIDQNQNIGAIGVRILNEKGKDTYLGKRGKADKFNILLFCTGLWKICKKFKMFNGYSLAYLSNSGIYKVNSVSELYILMPKAIFYKTNGFDEELLWGRNLDLCNKINKLNFDIVYYGQNWIMKLKDDTGFYFLRGGTKKLFHEIKSYYDKYYGYRKDIIYNNIAYFFIRLFCTAAVFKIKKQKQI